MALIAAHRGVHGRTARGRVDENTVDAIEAAIAAGADMVEIDVRRTLDGEHVLVHNARIGGVPVGRFTHEQLSRRLGHKGLPWPRLEDVVRQCAGRISLDVELKEPGEERAIGDLLLRHLQPDEFVVTSFHDNAVAAMKRSHPGIFCGLLLGSARPSARAQISEIFPFPRVGRCGADLIVPHASIADLVIPRAARRGIGVMVWTMGRESKLDRYVNDPRVHAVITDRVSTALSLRQGRAVDSREGLGA